MRHQVFLTGKFTTNILLMLITETGRTPKTLEGREASTIKEYEIIGFLDDDLSNKGKYCLKIPVYGNSNEISILINEYKLGGWCCDNRK
mgnify:FL=1|jgi:FlaA1/EpsC-like NDP-sugar epimerase